MEAEGTELGLMSSFSNWAGAPEEALRLLLTLFLGYPLAALYRISVEKSSNKSLHHFYFASCGLALCFFNYGVDTYHSMLSIFVTYAFVKLLRQWPICMLTVNFIFHSTYLITGYYYTASNEYDILWTMPHCILVLRLIGFGFDVADGTRPAAELSKDQKENALNEVPTLLELMGYAYFPSSFLVGPQYPFRRYSKFTNGDFRPYKGSVNAGMRRLAVGIAYLGLSQLGSAYLPNDYFLSAEYRNEGFIRRLVYLGLWGKFTLYKYILCWLLTEGALICFGITYNGKDETGKDDWSGCTNVRLSLLESGHTMEDYVRSFNVNTNHWVANYIYKRLKFMNNRNISYAAALIFLAIWHGLHSGYYMTFAMEFLIVTTEKQISSVYKKEVLPVYGDAINNNKLYQAIYFIIMKSYNIVYMGWCLIAFVHLKFDRWIAVMRAVNYFGFIYMAIWAALFNLYKYQKRAAARAEQQRTFSGATDLSPIVGGGAVTTDSGGTKED